MKENLYHEKNIILMGKIAEMIPYLCSSYKLNIKLIEGEAKFLRELYVKLFIIVE